MPFEKISGFDGMVFVPESSSHSHKKHPCADCFACQFCDDDRCRICRNEKNCSINCREQSDGKKEA